MAADYTRSDSYRGNNGRPPEPKYVALTHSVRCTLRRERRAAEFEMWCLAGHSLEPEAHRMLALVLVLLHPPGLLGQQLTKVEVLLSGGTPPVVIYRWTVAL